MKKAHFDYLKRVVHIALNLKEIADVANQINQLRAYRPPIYGMIKEIAADRRFYSVTENTPFWHRYALASVYGFIDSIAEEDWASADMLAARRESFLNTWYFEHSEPMSSDKIAEIEKDLQDRGWSKPFERREDPVMLDTGARSYVYNSDDRLIRDCTGSSGIFEGERGEKGECKDGWSKNGDTDSEVREESALDLPVEIKNYDARLSRRDMGQAAGVDYSPHEAEILFMRRIDPSLRRLAKMIGRSGAEMETEVRGRFQHSRRSDISGITVGDDLSSVLPSELALLGDISTERVFYRKYTQKRLQVFSSSSFSTEKCTERKGAIFLCVDTSGSMRGAPDTMAKSLSLAVAIIAQRERRPVCVVKYSDDVSFFILRNLERQHREFMRFLSQSYGVGNNETLLFNFLFRMLPTNKDYRRFKRYFRNADLLVVSDFAWSNIDETTAEVIRTVHSEGMRFYALGVQDGGVVREPDKYINGTEFGGPEFLRLCDHRFTSTGLAVHEVS